VWEIKTQEKVLTKGTRCDKNEHVEMPVQHRDGQVKGTESWGKESKLCPERPLRACEGQTLGKVV
jgi:hypothetical protein